MSRLLVIGIGNRMMQDDSIGIRVTEILQKQLIKHGIITIIGETDFQYCFTQIKATDTVVVIDAMYQNKPPASVEILPLRQALCNRGMLRTQHQFSLLDLLASHYPDLDGYFIGIEALQTSFGTELSPVLNQKFHTICNSVLAMILAIHSEIC